MRRQAFAALLLLATKAQGQSTVHHTFTTPGLKTVTLTVCNANGCDTKTKTLPVLDPYPIIRSPVVIPPLLGSAQLSFRLTADVAGGPPLSPVWTIAGSPLRSAPQSFPLASTDWTPDALGLYRITFSLSNYLGTVTQPTVSTRVIPTSFADVSPEDPFWPAIETLRAVGITGGCADLPPRFCPGSIVSRAETAVFIDRAKHPEAAPPPAVGLFADVPTDFWSARFIERLYTDAITGGCGTHPLRFCPNDPLSRADAAVLLERARRGRGYVPPPAVGLFLDVPRSLPQAPWIEQLFHDGITSGCSPQRFCPNDSATRGQIAVFLTRAFNLSQTPNATAFLARTCSSQDCTFSNQPIQFDLNVSRGIPDLYEYDWNGDGSFEEASTLPITTHTYSVSGTYRPVVRIHHGSSSSTLAHPLPILIRTADVFRAPKPPSSPQVLYQRDRLPTFSDTPGTLARRELALQASSAGARGFLLYVALDGGSFFYLTALPAIPGAQTFSVPLQTKALALKILAFNDYGPSASFALVNLTLP
ncbi:MAG: S-layer homology domain-containing protein [Acidobacteria bacterium]|nr:S-layer homology domain-containing protein [Acidobacteriota bacterium]